MNGKKERGSFYLLRRFSPRKNSKLNSICLDLKKQNMTKDNIRHFRFVCFCHWKLEPNVPLRGWEEGACPTDTDGIACREENKGMYTVGVRVCVHECVCQRVNGQLVNTFLGTKLFQPVLWGNVQMLCGLAKKKKTSRCIGFNTWMKELSISVWLLFHSKMSEATEETITSFNWQVELPGVLVLHVLRAAALQRLQTRGLSVGKK